MKKDWITQFMMIDPSLVFSSFDLLQSFQGSSNSPVKDKFFKQYLIYILMVSEMHIHNNIIEIIHNPSYMRKQQYKDWKKNFLYS